MIELAIAPGAIGALGLYTGLNLAILLWLAVQTGRVRQQTGVMIGDGGNARLIRVMRGHANALEFIPVTLIAMTACVLLAAPVIVIHAMGLALTLGRFFHALHFAAAEAPLWQRMIGFALSALAMLAAGGWAVIAGLVAMV